MLKHQEITSNKNFRLLIFWDLLQCSFNRTPVTWEHFFHAMQYNCFLRFIQMQEASDAFSDLFEQKCEIANNIINSCWKRITKNVWKCPALQSVDFFIFELIFHGMPQNILRAILYHTFNIFSSLCRGSKHNVFVFPKAWLDDSLHQIGFRVPL